MKNYIIQIVGAALLAVFADILSPDGWKKYLSIITGIILLTVIVTPVANLKDIDVLSGYHESNAAIESGNEIYADMLKNEFSKNVAIDVQERLREEFSVDAAVEVEVEVNERGNIEKILSITITGKNLSDKISERISYIYDVDEVILNGN